MSLNLPSGRKWTVSKTHGRLSAALAVLALVLVLDINVNGGQILAIADWVDLSLHCDRRSCSPSFRSGWDEQLSHTTQSPLSSRQLFTHTTWNDWSDVSEFTGTSITNDPVEDDAVDVSGWTILYYMTWYDMISTCLQYISVTGCLYSGRNLFHETKSNTMVTLIIPKQCLEW